jgi:DNA-binding NtrC family response regulator
MIASALNRDSVAQRIAVLSVSPAEEDHFYLQNILSNPQRTLYPDLAFSMTAKSTIAAAKSALRPGRISIVVCEYDLSPGSWTDLLEYVDSLPSPPALIVTSRVADEHMWAEVLNLGGYDVLAKPLSSEEVIRTITSAWSLWQRRFRIPAESVQTSGGNAA